MAIDFSKLLKKPEELVPDPKLSPDQLAAIDAIRNSDHKYFFVTGSAGSGKSFVMNEVKRLMKNVSMTATTGSAAQLIGGRTLHAFAGILPKQGCIMSKKAAMRMALTQVLIIDEASMMDSWLLDQLLLRCKWTMHYPKIVLVGDFFQLPPVDGTPVYQHPLWQQFKVLKLTHNHRQGMEGKFVEALNDLRYGDYTERLVEMIKSRTVDALPQDCTTLVAHRNTAAAINDDRLKQLGKPIKLYKADDDFPVGYNTDKMRFPTDLKLAEGARIVMLKNTEQFFNGSTGVVEHIGSEFVRVKLDARGRDEEAWTVAVERETEEVQDGDGAKIGSRLQYPMMLAWGLTIHKSQGMTLDRVGIDLNAHFAPGQTYVALSRCRSVEGLFLVGNFVYVPLPYSLRKFLGLE